MELFELKLTNSIQQNLRFHFQPQHHESDASDDEKINLPYQEATTKKLRTFMETLITGVVDMRNAQHLGWIPAIAVLNQLEKATTTTSTNKRPHLPSEGGGSGIGFQVMCNETLLVLTAGVGGGGAFENGNTVRGGGGGGLQFLVRINESDDSWLDIGGGQGCTQVLESSGKGIIKCGATLDDSDRSLNSSVLLLASYRQYVRKVKSLCSSFKLIGGGGGGGGEALIADRVPIEALPNLDEKSAPKLRNQFGYGFSFELRAGVPLSPNHHTFPTPNTTEKYDYYSTPAPTSSQPFQSLLTLSWIDKNESCSPEHSLCRISTLGFDMKFQCCALFVCATKFNVVGFCQSLAVPVSNHSSNAGEDGFQRQEDSDATNFNIIVLLRGFLWLFLFMLAASKMGLLAENELNYS